MDRHFAAATALDARRIQEGRPSVGLDPRYAQLVPSALVAEPRAYVLNNLSALEPHRGQQRPQRVYELRSEQSADDSAIIAKVAKPENNGVVDRRGRWVFDPLFELKMLYWVAALQLPCAQGIGHVAVDHRIFILYRKIPGYNCKERSISRQLPGCEGKVIRQSIRARIAELAPAFERVGIHRRWKEKDAIFTVDAAGDVASIVPIDWECVRLDWRRLDPALAERGVDPVELVSDETD